MKVLQTIVTTSSYVTGANPAVHKHNARYAPPNMFTSMKCHISRHVNTKVPARSLLQAALAESGARGKRASSAQAPQKTFLNPRDDKVLSLFSCLCCARPFDTNSSLEGGQSIRMCGVLQTMRCGDSVSIAAEKTTQTTMITVLATHQTKEGDTMLAVHNHESFQHTFANCIKCT